MTQQSNYFLPEDFTSGQIVRLRNGDFNMVMYDPFGSVSNREDSMMLVTLNGRHIPLTDYNDNLMYNTSGTNSTYVPPSQRPQGSQYDIMAIFENDHQLRRSDQWHLVEVREDPIWERQIPTQALREELAPSAAQGHQKEANIKTQVWIEVNGKPVDPNNMSEYEAKLLVSLGMMPPDILEDFREPFEDPECCEDPDCDCEDHDDTW